MNPNFFTQNSPYLNHPLLTAERTAREVNFALSQLNVRRGAEILDIGCGFGRHSIELARRGYNVTGIDPSAAMIEAAEARAKEADVSARFITADGETFGYAPFFEAVICLFTTLGQIHNNADNRDLLFTAHYHLTKRSRCLIEVPQREPTVANLKPHDRFGSAETYTDITRKFDSETNIVTETFELVSPQETNHFLLQYHLFSSAELNDLVTAAGFKIIEQFSNYDGNPLTKDSPFMLLVAEK